MADPLVARDLERYVLGAAMVSPADVIDKFDDLQPTDFYDAGHQKLWRLLLQMSTDRQQVDIRTVCEHVRHDDSAYGGLAYVAGLSDEVVSTKVDFHVKRLRDLALRRDVRTRLKDGLDSIAAFDADVDSVVSSIDPGQDAAGGSLLDARDVAYRAHSEVVQARQAAAEGQQTGATTPWPKVTRRWTNFLQPEKGGLIIVAGRPGMGKTSLGLQLCQHTTHTMVPDRAGGFRPGHVAVFSLEMADTDCMQVMAQQRSGVPSTLAKSQRCSADAADQYDAALESISTERLWVDSTPGLSCAQICRRVRRHIARHGPLDYVMVDYAELMDVADGSKHTRYDQQLGKATANLRDLGRELGFIVILIWQLNRKCESRSPPIPMLSDLAESGQAERHADLVVLVYRDDYYFKDQSSEPGKVRVITAKIRKGQPGVDVLDWVGECTAIRELDDRWG